MTRVRITEVLISGTPFPIQAFDVDVDLEEVFIEVRRPGGELHQRIKVDIKEAMAKGRTVKQKEQICSSCGVAKEKCPRIVLGLSALACCPDCSHASVIEMRKSEPCPHSEWFEDGDRDVCKRCGTRLNY